MRPLAFALPPAACMPILLERGLGTPPPAPIAAAEGEVGCEDGERGIKGTLRGGRGGGLLMVAAGATLIESPPLPLLLLVEAPVASPAERAASLRPVVGAAAAAVEAALALLALPLPARGVLSPAVVLPPFECAECGPRNPVCMTGTTVHQFTQSNNQV